jgi:[ribosomal protein S5]-alanine N-acetyltransferase
MANIIETDRLRIVACDLPLLDVLLSGKRELGKHLGVRIPDSWPHFGLEIFTYVKEHMERGEEEEGWWSYLALHKSEKVLIGSGGYKGSPDENGVVDVGYEIASEYRNRGFATEFARALTANALADPRVMRVEAHTLAEENASTSVLRKCGFRRVGSAEDEEQGIVWKWRYTV